MHIDPPESQSYVSWPAFVGELKDSFPPTRAVRQFLGHTPARNLRLPTADRWVLTSNLHKAVRYGLVEEAAVTAEALFRLDPSYFHKRLPVIAFEDVGLGNLPVCLEVLTFCRNLVVHRKFQGMGLAGYLGARLASAPKCRSACDLLCLVENQNGRESLEREIAGLGFAEAATTAESATTPLRQRAVAFLRLDRLPIRGGNQRAAALNEVCRRLELPTGVTQALITGNATESMSTFLPLVFGLMSTRQLRIEHSDLNGVTASLEGPILCAALDKHTRPGQRAIKEWLRAVPEMTRFFAQHGLVSRAERVTAVALFHVESSMLNRRLTNDCLELLRHEYERSDVAAFGLHGSDAAELYALTRSPSAT